MQLGNPVASPTGLVLWPLTGVRGMSIIWLGPGGGLFLGFDATVPDGVMTRIEHPTADGQYMTRIEAARAARRFVEAR